MAIFHSYVKLPEGTPRENSWFTHGTVDFPSFLTHFAKLYIQETIENGDWMVT